MVSGDWVSARTGALRKKHVGLRMNRGLRMTTVAGLGGGGSPKSRKYTTHVLTKDRRGRGGIDERTWPICQNCPLLGLGFPGDE